MKYTPNDIQKLEANQVFCFGSNEKGIHGLGAAKAALKFGAIYGKTGLVGQTYGINTKDANIKTLPLNKIYKEIEKFVKVAEENPQLEFLLTPIGCGLAAYQPKQIAPFFNDFDLPQNIIFPESFVNYLRK